MAENQAIQTIGVTLPTGVSLGLQQRGTGPVSVFLHGIGGHAGQWAPILDRLGTSGCLLAWDARGYGSSTGPKVQDFGDFADDLIGCLSSLGLTRVLGVGHSMGGRILIEAACRAPDRFGALLLSGAQPAYLAHMSREDARGYVDARRTMFDGDEVLPEMARKVAVQVLAPGTPENTVATLADDFKRLKPKGFLAAIEASLTWDRRNEIPDLPMPVEVVGGALDPVCPEEETRELARMVGTAPVLFDDVAHMPQIEAPDRFADAIRKFIARHSNRASSLTDKRAS